MNKDEIKKALVCCRNYHDCKKCPYLIYVNCISQLCEDALNLINEQEKEIEQLKAENERLEKVVSEKVYDFIDNLKEIADAREAWEKQAKVDVLKRLKERYGFYSCCSWMCVVKSLAEIIDGFIKEIEE